METSDYDKNCPFCNLDPAKIIDENEFGFVIEDAYPVTHGHKLIVVKHHRPNLGHMTQQEQAGLWQLVMRQRYRMKGVDGFNIGVNEGVAAGQTVLHLHIHLIPRILGDIANPKGGVRGVIPQMQDYAKGD
jgi:diadenosine tetraphosphate (Ap4A) HIT family hydrolase